MCLPEVVPCQSCVANNGLDLNFWPILLMEGRFEGLASNFYMMGMSGGCWQCSVASGENESWL